MLHRVGEPEVMRPKTEARRIQITARGAGPERGQRTDAICTPETLPSAVWDPNGDPALVGGARSSRASLRDSRLPFTASLASPEPLAKRRPRRVGTCTSEGAPAWRQSHEWVHRDRAIPARHNASSSIRPLSKWIKSGTRLLMRGRQLFSAGPVRMGRG